MIYGKNEALLKRRLICGILLLAVIGMVLFFTFQEPTKSRALSEMVRAWLGTMGIRVTYKALRSNIHLLEYFIVGLVVMGFFRVMRWKPWIGLVVALTIGAIDEGLKNLLPGREFELGDLIRNGIGVLFAAAVISVVLKVKNRRVSSGKKNSTYR